jgi:hypothetical protein
MFREEGEDVKFEFKEKWVCGGADKLRCSTLPIAEIVEWASSWRGGALNSTRCFFEREREEKKEMGSYVGRIGRRYRVIPWLSGGHLSRGSALEI